MEPETPTPSPSSPPDSEQRDYRLKHAKHLEVVSEEASGPQSIRERILAGLDPINRRPDGRETYLLPNGMRMTLNPRRQAKKLIQDHEGLSPRQYKKLRKQLQRAAKLPPKEDNA